jgi:hypothetical protein
MASLPQRPTLRASAGAVARWRSTLGPRRGERPRVGLVWAGNPNVKNDRIRSPGWLQIRGLLDRTDIDWYVLQMGAGRAPFEREVLPAALRGQLTDLAPQIESFDDTAAILGELDLLITSDTSVAPLGGALGVDLRVMVPHVCDWRWGRSCTATPWYPTATVVRQSDFGDWRSVVGALHAQLDRVVAELGKLSVDQQLTSSLRELNAGHSAAAEALARAALVAAPTRPDTWTLLGLALRRGGFGAHACAVLREAVALQPTYPDAVRILAQTQEEIGDFAAALLGFERLAALNPTEPAAPIGRARCLNALGRTDEATGLLAQLDAGEHFVEAALQRARAALTQPARGSGEVDEPALAALQALSPALERLPADDPRAFDLRILQAETLQRLYRHAQAAQAWQAALQALLRGLPLEAGAGWAASRAAELARRHGLARASQGGRV